jgi:hypothetical protein
MRLRYAAIADAISSPTRDPVALPKSAVLQLLLTAVLVGRVVLLWMLRPEAVLGSPALVVLLALLYAAAVLSCRHYAPLYVRLMPPCSMVHVIFALLHLTPLRNEEARERFGTLVGLLLPCALHAGLGVAGITGLLAVTGRSGGAAARRRRLAGGATPFSRAAGPMSSAPKQL